MPGRLRQSGELGGFSCAARNALCQFVDAHRHPAAPAAGSRTVAAVERAARPPGLRCLGADAGRPRCDRFLFESPYIRVKHELAAYAADCFPPGRPVLVGTRALMAKIFKEFKFDPEATTVATPVLEVLANKRGVCQDFAT